jgi:hypothetical protein
VKEVAPPLALPPPPPPPKTVTFTDVTPVGTVKVPDDVKTWPLPPTYELGEAAVVWVVASLNVRVVPLIEIAMIYSFKVCHQH